MQTFRQYLSEQKDTEGFTPTHGSTPHAQLRHYGWKKTGKAHETHVYTHPEHVGHEIHLHTKTGAFEHKINHKTGDLTQHLDTHQRQSIYAADRAVSKANSPGRWTE